MKFNGPNSISFKNAQKDFAESLAGYSLVCYILQIKDRHNQNILVDRHGHILHIDFGFMLGNSPGGNLNFESAPFKLTEEFEQVLGGRRSKSFNRYRRLCVEGFRALKDKAEQIILMLEMMQTGSGLNLPCFSDGENVIKEFRNRLIPKPNMTRGEYKKYVNSLIDESLGHWTTNWYDRFQYYMQGIIY
jgi:phosphatidylinositol 4-kinase